MSVDSSSFEPVEAEGAGAQNFSMPELFYLTNQKQIEEWAALKRTAADAQNRWLEEQVEPAIATLAEGRDLRHESCTDNSWRRSLLVADGTPDGLTRPLVGVGLGWNRADLTKPFVGVAIEERGPGGEPVDVTELSLRIRAIGKTAGYENEPRWPAWQYSALPERWWSDLDATLSLLVAEFSTCLDLFEPVLQDVARVHRD